MNPTSINNVGYNTLFGGCEDDNDYKDVLAMTVYIYIYIYIFFLTIIIFIVMLVYREIIFMMLNVFIIKVC